MLGEARAAAGDAAAERGCTVSESEIWRIEPIAFDPGLVALAREACRRAAGSDRELVSGALHDAAEIARAGVPTVMLFVQSLGGLSHNKDEDTRPEHIELSVDALDRLAAKTIGRVESGR
jgi:N-carbamoyl-L-amino-acid hydrolase